MKITILGSCRQHSVIHDFETSQIHQILTYPHYSKEIIQTIEFCQTGNMMPEDTLYTFRTCLLYDIPIFFSKELYDEFNADVYLVEIASKIEYVCNNKYVHHIAEDNVKYKDNVTKQIQTKDELEKDVIKINDLLNKKCIIISHLVTRDTGERYVLKCWLEEICNKHNILFIDPIKELSKEYNVNDLFENDQMFHYNENGEKAILKIYKDFINKLTVSI